MARKNLKKSKSRNKTEPKNKSKSKKRIKKHSKKRSKKDGGLYYISGGGELEPKYDTDEDSDDIYRKYVYPGEKGENELKIVDMLKNLFDTSPSNYNKNLIIIREIGQNDIGKFYETDVIDTYTDLDDDGKVKLIEQINKLNETRLFLQKNNIAYIDWKFDNTGLDSHGEIKLFDFDCSGTFIVPPEGEKNYPYWEIEPPNDSQYYKYANAIFNKYLCYNTPLNLDTFLFRNMLFLADVEQTDLPQ